MQNIVKFFSNPKQSVHRKYEVLRAVYLEGKTSEHVARQFGYSTHTINSLRRDFQRSFKNGLITAEYFFITPSPGRKPSQNIASIEEEIIGLRKQNHSILDIQSTLQAKGYNISHGQIHKILQQDGFAKLPKRSAAERLHAKSLVVKAPQSRAIDWEQDNNKFFCSERGIGVLPFLPVLADLGLDKWIETAGYPETSEIGSIQSILSFLALKLSGHKRYHHDDLWAMDRAFGLFAALNVLPKTTTLSTYSSRVSRNMNKRFLTAMINELEKRKLYSGNFNMDFTAIPHWGDDSVLENNWSGKRNKALKSVLAGLTQDSETGVFGHSNAELKKENQSQYVLEFVDFWKNNQKEISCLIFDSKFTIYENLEKLDKDDIKFITLRRRGPKIIKQTEEIPEENWETIIVEGESRKRRKVAVHDSEVFLNKNIKRKFRQIIVKNNGHANPSFFITNDRDHSASQIIRKYGKRWNVEKGISEQIEFFHLNSLSSSIVVKVDFDLTMTIAAHNIYRVIAQSLEGFEKESATSLNNKFFSNSGQIEIKEDSIVVEMKKKRHLPILMSALDSFANKPISWLGGRQIKFSMWATS